MNMKIVSVILWLSFSLSALAQNAPMRTVPAHQPEFEVVEDKINKLIETSQPPPVAEEVKKQAEQEPLGKWRKVTSADQALEQENEELREKIRLLEQLTDRDKLIRLRAKELQAKKLREEAEKKTRKKDEDRFSRQARKEIEKKERRERDAQKRAAQAVGNADIFCPDSRKLDEVVIHNTNHFIYNRFQAFNRVTVMNPSPATIRISAIDPNRNRSGAVADLPGGCSITLSRSIVPLLETGWGGVRFSYIAQPLDGANAGKTARSQEFFLFGGNSFQQMNTSVWELRFY